MASDALPFALFTLPRTGSYHLVSLLDSAPDIDCLGEVFKANRVELSPARLAAVGLAANDLAARDADPIGLLDRLRALGPDRLFGFKLMADHVRERPALRKQVLFDPHWRKVVLRRDPLQRYASLLRAQQSDVWTLKGGREVDPAVLNQPVRFDAESFEEHMRINQRFETLVAKALERQGNPVLEVDYAQVVAGEGLARILQFLGSGAAAADLRSEYGQQYGAPFEQAFANWDELQRHVNGRAGP